MRMDRRKFMQLAGLAGLVFIAPSAAFAGTKRSRVVVFVELSGGNDGLNTVIPRTDPLYRKLRPSLALPDKEILGLDKHTGLHSSLKKTAGAWEKGELAVVEGLGYADPNRSHFRSIEIWETGSDAEQYEDAGWVARAVPGAALEKYTPAALTVGGGGDGPLIGARSLEIEEPEKLFKLTRRLQRADGATSNPALAHVLKSQNELLDAVDTLHKHVDGGPSFDKQFGKDRRLRPLKLAAELVASGLPLLAVKIRIPGFDTHVNQARPHARLLEVLDGGLGAFRAAMKAAGIWDDVLIVTYSEFGRRARENGGGGTDHGTAAPHLILGGKVKGGLYGKRPALDELDANGDLRYTTDFRSLYNTVASDWWGFDNGDFKEFGNLGFV